MEKKRILFVDDDPKVLESMQRIFFDMDDDWDMEFATSGKEALAVMSERSFDVIVSDMRMPEMDGAQLLTKVKELYPSTVRFILSGFSDKEMILRTVGPADQFLTKPCDPDLLKRAIVDALDSQKLVDKKTLREMISQMRSLPALPAVYIRLKEAIDSPKSSFQDIARIVEGDIAITAKVLQLVNSAFFGLRKRIDNLQLALTYLGLESLKAVILTTDVFSKFSKEEMDTFQIESLYEHSIFVSMLARKIMGTINNDKKIQDAACMAGMLHDVGKVIFIRNRPDEYKEVYRRARAENKPFFILEREIFDITHADIGGYLMSTWGLPDEIVKTISLHHNVKQAVGIELDPMAVVFISNLLAHEEISGSADSLEQEITKGSLSKVQLMKYLPEWRDMTKIVQEIQNKGMEGNDR